MTGKVNAVVKMNRPGKLKVELWDVDVLADDRIETKNITESEAIEFLFNTTDTGEFNPELQLRIFDEDGKELYRSPINSSINSVEINNVTGFRENTTVDFGLIEV
jgi:hypothetical protein